MRILHTADWHLGRLFYGIHLTEDQAVVLAQITQLIKEAAIDVVIIAGDVYDRAVPPTDAVRLLDDTLSEVLLGLGKPVVLISGNHDSPDRLSFGSRLFAERGLFVRSSCRNVHEPTILHDSHGPVQVFLVPYAEPPVVRNELNASEVNDHITAMKAVVSRIEKGRDSSVRSILVGHAFVAGGMECESERPLSVGGASHVDPMWFKGFDYVALGHLHQAQSAGSGSIRYSGSIMKYSFSETDHKKGVTIVEMNEEGRCSIEEVSVSSPRDVRCIEGTMDELTGRMTKKAGINDYLHVRLLDKGAVLDAMGKLRRVYPNVLHIERPVLESGAASTSSDIDHRRMTELELFESFVKEVTGEELTAHQRKAFVSTVEELHRRQREVNV